MKTMVKISMLLIAAILMFSSCEKEDPLQPDKNALRISKIADNRAMSDPWWAFEYNEDGLVTKITGDRANDTIHLTYNNDNLPVKIVIAEVRSVIDNYVVYDTILINWSQNSFTLNQEYYFENETYTLDANGRLVSIDDDYEIQWNGNKADAYYLPEGAEKEWAQTRELTEYNHPLSAINHAILIACDISWIFDECEWVFQNKYCLDNLSSVDEGSADYTYEFNEDGYPTQMDMYETTEHATWMFYFEYETN